ncbi:MAG: hypothetical protein JO244_09040 [Solirubrobacterales bacterium]|nr:hypothetical protein [Solirubrobacterales bacterium]
MPRPYASVPPEAIRIEDEVWQEAFARRESARPRREPEQPRPRLRAIDGGLPLTPPKAEAPVSAATLAQPRTDAAQRPPKSPPAAAPPRVATNGGVPGRRTVTIRGYGAERNLPWPDSPRRRPQRPVHERAGFRPDRVALWAVMLGILLVLVAIASPHG